MAPNRRSRNSSQRNGHSARGKANGCPYNRAVRSPSGLGDVGSVLWTRRRLVQATRCRGGQGIRGLQPKRPAIEMGGWPLWAQRQRERERWSRSRQPRRWRCGEPPVRPTQRDSQLQTGVVAAGRATGRALSEAWKEKAAREEANLPPTQRDKQLQAGVVATGRALSEAWKEKAAREEANVPPTQRDKQLQAGVVAAGRALSEAWKEKAAREEANLPPTQRNKQLQAGRAAAALTRKRKIENDSGLLGYQDTMRS
ncbi:hypothetical protein HaLaN_00961 [Haematococcus lacustris]|uniref:Uncharacterized protein n=1 Tax=Haematococcus lacustris TaxID=44745 RepID=A0A699YH44_HAELA|nr:hypothetical protein HaLaN_00961 [Haematococcus lacustris]